MANGLSLSASPRAMPLKFDGAEFPEQLKPMRSMINRSPSPDAKRSRRSINRSPSPDAKRSRRSINRSPSPDAKRSRRSLAGTRDNTLRMVGSKCFGTVDASHPQLEPVYCSVKGPCGHEADLDRFCKHQPANHFKCPICGTAFKIEQEPATVLASGFVMPGKKSIVICNS
jgi:hypothetical protein